MMPAWPQLWHPEAMSVRGPSSIPPLDRQNLTVGERIRVARLAKGLTQEDLGTALNTDQTAISSWERDRVKPSGAALVAISQLFNVSLEAWTAPGAFVLPSPAATEESNTTIQLPPLGSAVIQWMDLNQAQSQPLADTQEALLRLIEATRKGRGVWIVVK